MAIARLIKPEDRRRAERQFKAISVERIAERLEHINRVNPGHCQDLVDAANHLRDYARELVGDKP